MSRTISVGGKFQVDGVSTARDGAGRPWYAVQMVDTKHGNAKYCQVFCEGKPGELTPDIRVDTIIGAPLLCIRNDGTAYVCGGGRNNTIVISDSLAGWIPRIP